MRIQWPPLKRGSGRIALAAACLCGNLYSGCARNTPRSLSALNQQQPAVVQTVQEQAPLQLAPRSAGPDFVVIKEETGPIRDRQELETLLSNSQPDKILRQQKAIQPINTDAHPGQSFVADYAIVHSTQEDDGHKPDRQNSSIVIAPQTCEPELATSSATDVHSVLGVAHALPQDVDTPTLQPAQHTEPESMKSTPAINIHPKNPERASQASSSRQTLSMIQPDPQEIEQKSVVTRAPEIVIPPEQVPSRLRMQQLVAAAIESETRGDLHAAYRSALLAQKIADEHHIAVDRLEPSPTALAETIAEKIWKTSLPEPTRQESDLPVIKAQRIPEHDAIFQIADSSLLWEPLQNSIAGHRETTASEIPKNVNEDFGKLRNNASTAQKPEQESLGFTPWQAVSSGQEFAPPPPEEHSDFLSSEVRHNSDLTTFKDAQVPTVARKLVTHEGESDTLQNETRPSTANGHWGVVAFIAATFITLILFRLNDDRTRIKQTTLPQASDLTEDSGTAQFRHRNAA